MFATIKNIYKVGFYSSSLVFTYLNYKNTIVKSTIVYNEKIYKFDELKKNTVMDNAKKRKILMDIYLLSFNMSTIYGLLQGSVWPVTYKHIYKSWKENDTSIFDEIYLSITRND
jgi:hypothetical protein